MIKSKLVKAFFLGIGLSALITSAAFAQTGKTTTSPMLGLAVTSSPALGAATSAPALGISTTDPSEIGATEAAPPTRGEVLSEEQIALYAKQKDIDQYLFADHADEVAKMGFTVNYTGLTSDAVEIGISPYTQKNADYLYGLFGKDGITVVEAPANILYGAETGIAQSGVGYAEPGVIVSAEPGAIVNPADVEPLPPVLYKGEGALPAEPALGAPNSVDGSAGGTGTADPSVVSSLALPNAQGTKTEEAPAADTASSDEMTIQIESADAAKAADSGVMYETTAVASGQSDVAADTAGASDTGIRTTAVAANSNAAPVSDSKNANRVDSSMFVFAIAGAAVLIGGGIIAAKKKKK